YFEEMRDIIREHAGETDPEFARILQNLALAFRRSGREQEAEACARRAAEILDTHGSEMEDSSGACKPADQESLGRRPYDIQVGQALALYAQGDHERAQEIQRKVLASLPQLPLPAIFERAMGHPLDPFLAHIGRLDEEGHAAEQRGELAEALGKYEQVARLIEASLGTRHPKNAEAINNLAQIAREQGRFD